MSRWDDLSMAEKAEMMKVAVRNGIYSLSDIREKYNEFAEGGNLYAGTPTDNDVVDWIIKEEGNLSKPTDIGDGMMTLGSGLTAKKWHDLYKKRGNKWSDTDNRMAVAEEVATRRRWAERNIPNWDTLPESSQKALLSYKYNYDFNKANSPKLFKALAENNLSEAARQINATSKNPKFKKGLMQRRLREQEWFLSDVGLPGVTSTPASVEVPVSTAFYNPYAQQVENTTVAPMMVPDEDSYIKAHRLTEQEERRQRFQERVEAINNLNRLLKMTSVSNTAAPAFMPTTGNTFLDSIIGLNKAEGGSIHIKHPGRLTALKKRTGKTEAELYNDGNPAHKRMVVFARNARKFKHGLGGNLFSGEEEGSQQMITTHKPYYDRDGILLYNRTLPETVIIPDSQLSPAERNYRERQRQRNLPDYAQHKDREITSRQVANAQKEWGNSFEKQALDYGQAIASGIGMGADMVSRLPIYSSLKGASTLSRAETPLNYVESGLWLAPIAGATYQAAKPIAQKAATEATIAWNLRNPEISNVFSDLHPATKKAEINTSTNKPVFIRWGNDERFAVQPSAEVYNDIVNQLKDARSYRTSSGYKELVNRFTKESRDKGIDFSESLFDGNNKSLSKLTVSNREAGHLGEYYPSTNRIDLDIAQIGGLKVPFHEGIHWQRVGAPADKIGPKFEKWLEARRAGDPNEAQLFEEFRNSTEYERYYQRKAADKAIQDKVEEALYPSADETLRNRGELQAYGLEAGKAIGIEPFSEYPGMIDALTAIEKARKYSPQLRDIKSGGEENVKRFWNILTGNYIPSTVIGAFGINSYLNK